MLINIACSLKDSTDKNSGRGSSEEISEEKYLPKMDSLSFIMLNLVMDMQRTWSTDGYIFPAKCCVWGGWGEGSD